VVVDNLDIARPSSMPSETDAPLVVDADRVLASAIALERLQPIPWWDFEVIESLRAVQETQLSQSDGLDFPRQATGDTATPDRHGPLVAKAADHGSV
jgi:hypothetical protein